MMPSRRRALWRIASVPLCIGILALVAGCRPALQDGPDEEAIRHNNIGTAFLSQQKWGDAESEFRAAVERVPDDPIPRNNLAVALVQQGKIDEAVVELGRGLQSSSDNPYLHYNFGLVEKNRGGFAEAVTHFEKVAAHDPDDLLTQYNLGGIYAQLDRPDEARRAYENALAMDPSHVSTLYGLGQFLLRQGDPERGVELIQQSQEVRARSGLDAAVGSQYGEQGPYALGVDYAGDRLSAPAPIEVRFVAGPASDGGPASAWTTLRTAGAGAAVLVATASGLQRLDADGVTAVTATELPGAVLALTVGDLDGDGTPETIAALGTEAGLIFGRLAPDGDGYRWGGPFGAAVGVAASAGGIDIRCLDRDHDGDLDVAACWSGASAGCLVGTNDGTGQLIATDGSEHGLTLPSTAEGRLSLAFSDLDNDRDVDLLVLSPGGLHWFSNTRDDAFADRSADAGLGQAVAERSALAIADIDKDGWMDLLVGGETTGQWLRNVRGRFTAVDEFPSAGDSRRIVVLDLDNDGFLDVARNVGIERNRGRRSFATFEGYSGESAAPVAAVDIDGDGDADLLVRSDDGALALQINEGGDRNRFLAIDSTGVGDNHFGIGAKVDVLSGALRQKFEIVDPLPLTIGLGSRESADTVRYLWPSGVLQDEIDQPAGERLAITQLDRKGTSCPLLYAWNGEGWRFVTDFLGGAAVGYRTGPTTYGTPDTDEYVKIDGGIVESDGTLRLRFNNQLEEVLWFDQVELLVVDHPTGSELFPNERLMPSPPFPEHRLFASRNVRALQGARDLADGRDVAGALERRDGDPVAGFSLLPYKGYAEPHTVELDLGPFANDDRVVLLLDGWIDYADSSANIAAAQAGVVLMPPVLTVADGRGGWNETGHLMGFPAGLPKTMAVELTGRFAGDDHRVRIATNMRIYWDRARVLLGGTELPLRETRLQPRSAELRDGGFPRPIRPGGHRAESYDPADVAAFASWKAHVGAYTSHGDVRPRLLARDDGFVTTRSGDEVELVFDAPPAPGPGWTRSYLLYADGFGKDMDPNSAASDTVGPIPFHGMTSYPYPPQVLRPGAPDDGVRHGRWVGPADRGWPGAVPLALAATIGDGESPRD